MEYAPKGVTWVMKTTVMSRTGSTQKNVYRAGGYAGRCGLLVLQVGIEERHDAVSYTHLDVYKRQPRDRSLRAPADSSAIGNANSSRM